MIDMPHRADVAVAKQGRTLPQRAFGNRTYRTVAAVYVFLVLLIIASRAVSPFFGSLSFTRTVVSLSAFTAVAAFGQFIVILTGGLDLSIPNVMTMTAVVLTGVTLGDNARVWWVLPLVLIMGLLIGALNGLGVVYLRLAPVVMTLAVNVILGGVVLVYTQGTPKGRTPSTITKTIQGRTLGGEVPTIIILLVVFTIIATLVMNQTIFGRYVYSIGNNRQTALLSGVPVNRVIITVYAVSGLCSALAGVMLAGFGNQSFLSLGDPYMLLSLAAVVVGGVSIIGGRGLYVGVVGGALILTTISITLSGTSLPPAVKQMIYAIAIVAAVVAARQNQT